MAQKVHVNDLTLVVPRPDRCWDFAIVHACGCPATTAGAGHVRARVVRVKRNRHSLCCSLRGCLRATATHVLPDACARCELLDAIFSGAAV
ncbi:hypothetical protein SAMD00023353_1501730 [Rosellinia necatrix]|uniref:Uncharacterized protein n=1 Tax=Rosellinia necatrix TaxID=77044 RepID=A0A1W2TRJ8_ROSNE|nr:hypothetical protein SAMD00023353_1501730 [Rosellinia necatrix]